MVKRKRKWTLAATHNHCNHTQAETQAWNWITKDSSQPAMLAELPSIPTKLNWLCSNCNSLWLFRLTLDKVVCTCRTIVDLNKCNVTNYRILFVGSVGQRYLWKLFVFVLKQRLQCSILQNVISEPFIHFVTFLHFQPRQHTLSCSTERNHQLT